MRLLHCTAQKIILLIDRTPMESSIVIKSNCAIDACLHQLAHYLPSQAPLKDFVHHNTLHAFADEHFDDALIRARKIFGYNTRLSLEQFREMFQQHKIEYAYLEQAIITLKGKAALDCWLERCTRHHYDQIVEPRVGFLRKQWFKALDCELDTYTHPILFRWLGSFLDQGIAHHEWCNDNLSFFETLCQLQNNKAITIFHSQFVNDCLANTEINLEKLLLRLVGDEKLIEQYIFDQQFAHPGWSGMVNTVATQPHTLVKPRSINLTELLVFECLLEIDYLCLHYGEDWPSIATSITFTPAQPLWGKVEKTELDDVLEIWQYAFEWGFYEQVLAAISTKQQIHKIQQQRKPQEAAIQAIFCIDDRECSIRRHVETVIPNAETFGTPGFFNVAIYYKSHAALHLDKVCPGPIQPQHVIVETNSKQEKSKGFKKDLLLTRFSSTVYADWLQTIPLGLLAAWRLVQQVLHPSVETSMSHSFHHMHDESELGIEYTQYEHNLKQGFEKHEMVAIVHELLMNIGLTKNFAKIIYIVGHGASSINNPHYSAYDCGACSGRAGSVNARAFAYMANSPDVRKELSALGITIPDETYFVSALHDTTRDEIAFYDIRELPISIQHYHQQFSYKIQTALTLNAQERSRRLDLVDTTQDASRVHKAMVKRSMSLFEPRPELNHATNALCVIGRRELTKGVFLDRRAFLNSYDYRLDETGERLQKIINAATPVCGGINLEYYFSKVDNHKLGAGSKLSHNVVGLFAVTNGASGDLRTGLPSQMIELHDPIRLMMIVEHYPDVVLNSIKANPNTWLWFKNEWIHLVILHPQTGLYYRWYQGKLEQFLPAKTNVSIMSHWESVISKSDNLPISIQQNQLFEVAA